MHDTKCTFTKTMASEHTHETGGKAGQASRVTPVPAHPDAGAVLSHALSACEGRKKSGRGYVHKLTGQYMHRE